MDPKTIELAWAAGLFDGEGYVRPVTDRYRMMSMHNTDLPMLRRFHAAVDGLGTIGKPENRPGRTVIRQWWACAANAATVATLLLPFVAPRNQRRLTELRDAFAADKQGACEFCGTIFVRNHADRRFCGKTCSTYARRERQRAELPPERLALIMRKSEAARLAIERHQRGTLPAPIVSR